MRKIISILILLATLLTSAAGCSQTEPYSEGEGELKIVASTFVPFDIAREITGGKASVSVLQTNGGDLHDYSPTTASLKAISDADILICIGGASDSLWVENAIKASENKRLTVIRLTELADGELAELEGHTHTPACEENHGGHHSEHDHDHSVDDGHGHTADEHIWTSLKNTAKAVSEIAKICAEKDTENADFYTDNAAKYLTKLNALDKEYTEAFEGSEKRTLVFADRFPFIYLVHDYKACYYAAFNGCGSEISASFETAVRLTEATKDNSLKYILITENSDTKLADSICDATGSKILVLDSMQSVSLSEIKDGKTYLKSMKSNLEILKKALS